MIASDFSLTRGRPRRRPQTHVGKPAYRTDFSPLGRLEIALASICIESHLRFVQIAIDLLSEIAICPISQKAKEVWPVISPGNLVSAVSAAFGIPESIVIQHDRRLTDAGLRRKGGRGNSAVEMGPEDVAKLLTAVLSGFGGVDVGKRTVELTSAIWDARLDQDISDELPAASELPFEALRLAVASPGVTFGKAFSAAMADLVDGALERLVRSGDARGKASSKRDAFRVSVCRPSLSASMSFLLKDMRPIELHFEPASAWGSVPQVLTTHATTALPLLEIASQMRSK